MNYLDMCDSVRVPAANSFNGPLDERRCNGQRTRISARLVRWSGIGALRGAQAVALIACRLHPREQTTEQSHGTDISFQSASGLSN